MTAKPQTLTVHWIDAFTQVPFAGNPAVVIPQADGLSVEQMQQIAREVNCSETAFICPATHPEARHRPALVYTEARSGSLRACHGGSDACLDD